MWKWLQCTELFLRFFSGSAPIYSPHVLLLYGMTKHLLMEESLASLFFLCGEGRFLHPEHVRYRVKIVSFRVFHSHFLLYEFVPVVHGE